MMMMKMISKTEREKSVVEKERSKRVPPRQKKMACFEFRVF